MHRIWPALFFVFSFTSIVFPQGCHLTYKSRRSLPFREASMKMVIFYHLQTSLVGSKLGKSDADSQGHQFWDCGTMMPLNFVKALLLLHLALLYSKYLLLHDFWCILLRFFQRFTRAFYQGWDLPCSGFCLRQLEVYLAISLSLLAKHFPTSCMQSFFRTAKQY